MEEPKILQIIPATGWGAVYNGDEGQSLDPITCFALVEEVRDGETVRSVRPMGPDGALMVFIDDASNFKTIAFGPNNLHIG